MYNNPARMNKKLAKMDSKAPHKCVSEFFATKQFLRLIKVYPEWDLPSSTPFYDLMMAKKEYQATENMLDEKRKERKVHREVLDTQWKALQEKQKTVNDSFANYRTFIEENEKKRERAEHVIKTEEEEQKKLEQNIKELKEKIEQSLKIREVMQSYVQQYSNYEEYLKKVVDASQEFRSIRDVIARYQTLITVQWEMDQRQRDDVATMEAYRKAMVELTVNKSQEMMALNNKLFELQSKCEQASGSLVWWQDMLSTVNDNASRLHVEKALVKSAIRNIHKQLCKVKSHQSSVNKEDYEAQLQFIKTSYQDLLKIVDIAKAKVARDEKSTIVNLSTDSK